MGNFPGIMRGVAEIGTAVGTIVSASQGGAQGGTSDKRRRVLQEYVRDPRLVEQVAEYQRQNAQLVAEYEDFSESIRNQGLESKIESFEDLKRLDKKAATTLIELAAKTKAYPMVGRNFGFFGVTSSGKSTIINKLLGQEVAEVGAGETTTKIEKYEGRNYTLYDIPGRNDEMSYFSMEYISFWKGLTGRLVVITATVKEMSKVLRLLDDIGLTYDIVVNKLDNVAVGERVNLKDKIRKEVNELGLKSGKRTWFVSAKNPDQFDEWVDMVNYLTT